MSDKNGDPRGYCPNCRISGRQVLLVRLGPIVQGGEVVERALCTICNTMFETWTLGEQP